ncbi:hypothetical protein LXL04_031408 [Taraxacum kok-saghyz]
MPSVFSPDRTTSAEPKSPAPPPCATGRSPQLLIFFLTRSFPFCSTPTSVGSSCSPVQRLFRTTAHVLDSASFLSTSPVPSQVE